MSCPPTRPRNGKLVGYGLIKQKPHAKTAKQKEEKEKQPVHSPFGELLLMFLIRCALGGLCVILTLQFYGTG
jgi:hypothetical protein